MEKLKISVIVPVYNVEKYVSKCIDSIINQTYKNLEIILIDDGSSDSSGKICDDYSIKDPRIKVKHIKNNGVSNARNLGIKLANGDYITFVDSDDYIELNMYERLISIIDNDRIPDIITSGFYYETAEGIVFSKSKKGITKFDVLNNEEAFNEVFIGRFGAYIWNKLFRKKLLLSNKIFFRDDIFSSEDLLFVCQSISYSNIIYHYNNDFYHYIKRKGSVTNSGFNKKLLTTLKAYDEIEKIAIKKFPNSINYVLSGRAFEVSNLIYKMRASKCQKSDIKLLKVWLKENKKCFMKNKMIDKKTKIIIILMSLNVNVGFFCWKLYKISRQLKYKY